MKIKAEDYNYMKKAFSFLKENYADEILLHKEEVLVSGKYKDYNKRIRWDLMRAAKLSPFICDNLYSYLDDTHIDTALRSIVKELSI